VLGAGALVCIVWEVGLWGRTCLSDPCFPWFPPTAQGPRERIAGPFGPQR